MLISPLVISTPFRSGFTCVSLCLAHSPVLNMLVTCEHWRSLTPTHVEGKVGGGVRGACRPQETPGCLAGVGTSVDCCRQLSEGALEPCSVFRRLSEGWRAAVGGWRSPAVPRRSPVVVTRPRGDGARRSTVAVTRPIGDGARWSTVAVTRLRGDGARWSPMAVTRPGGDGAPVSEPRITAAGGSRKVP